MAEKIYLAKKDDLEAEVTARTTADTTLNTSIQSVNSTLDTKIVTEEQRAKAAETTLEGKISGLSGGVKVEVVTTQPENPVNGTMYYIGTENPYTVKLYTNNTWYEMGTTTVDLSNYLKKSGGVMTGGLEPSPYTGMDKMGTFGICQNGANLISKSEKFLGTLYVGDPYTGTNKVVISTSELESGGDPLEIIMSTAGGAITHVADTVDFVPRVTTAGIPKLVLSDAYGEKHYNVLNSETIKQLVTLTKAQYDALTTKDANTLYCVTDE